MVILFLILLILLFYIYFLYPIILSLKRREVIERGGEPHADLPFVSLIIPAYNEEKHIEEKIRSSLNQDYPKDRLEIIIASDGSTDGTIRIAKSFQNPIIRVVEHTDRRGKNAVLNEAALTGKGDIFIFTDANAIFVKEAIKKLVAHFEDKTVGLVCGHLKYIKGKENNVGEGEGLYFRYESLIKRLESRWGAVAVVTGSIYAMRRSLFSPLDSEIANDFAHPVQVGARGYKVIFDPQAIAYEQTTGSASEEFQRRARIVTRGFTAFGKYWKTYSLLRGKRGFCFVSHKLLRWFAPFFLILLFVNNVFLEGPFFQFILYGQIVFYGAALFGLFINKRLGKMFAIPFYFCMINLAALVGFVRYLRGKRQSFWEIASTTR